MTDQSQDDLPPTLVMIHSVPFPFTPPPQTLKYRSRSTVILNRFDSFSKEIQSLMSGSQLSGATSSTIANTATAAAGTAVEEATSLSQSAVGAVEGAVESVVGTQPTSGTDAATGTGGGAGGGGGGQSKNKKKKKGGKK